MYAKSGLASHDKISDVLYNFLGKNPIDKYDYIEFDCDGTKNFLGGILYILLFYSFYDN